MLDTDAKRRIDTARDILVGKVPDASISARSARPSRYILRLSKGECCKLVAYDLAAVTAFVTVCYGLCYGLST